VNYLLVILRARMEDYVRPSMFAIAQAPVTMALFVTSQFARLRVFMEEFVSVQINALVRTIGTILTVPFPFAIRCVKMEGLVW